MSACLRSATARDWLEVTPAPRQDDSSSDYEDSPRGLEDVQLSGNQDAEADETLSHGGAEVQTMSEKGDGIPVNTAHSEQERPVALHPSSKERDPYEEEASSMDGDTQANKDKDEPAAGEEVESDQDRDAEGDAEARSEKDEPATGEEVASSQGRDSDGDADVLSENEEPSEEVARPKDRDAERSEKDEGEEDRDAEGDAKA
ncbi:unnamed protein product [Symbiodinium sp. KB8]|nr:unnamed protein product [Symbiodinium sp. KB8]